MSIKSQLELIHGYNDEHREKFNPVFFDKSDDEIPKELMKIILSCQRDAGFTIKILNFKIIDDYREINKILYNHEENLYKDKNKKRDNLYGYINMKDSDIKLLIVSYYIAIKEESEYIDVIIAFPRVVDRFYYRIGGNTYNAVWQIVDNATYNNSTSNSKKQSVILRTMPMKVIMYRDFANLLTTDGENVKCIFYKARIFNKTILIVKYFLGKFGFYNGLAFLNMSFIDVLNYVPEDTESKYIFVTNNVDIFVSVPKYIFDNDSVVQSIIYTICKCMYVDTVYSEIFTNDYWVKCLGREFNNNETLMKGYSILSSLEHIYDQKTYEVIHLPREDKCNIYLLLKWSISEFAKLKVKNNLDISTKRIRCEEYIASQYAMKISAGIYRVSDLGKRADINSIKKAIVTDPMMLLKAISRCDLVTYRNLVNDLDSITALKCTYKGLSGIGEQSNSVPLSYRSVNISHAGRIDLDSSSASDPGMSGTLCPIADLYDNLSFSEFEEPNSWKEEVSILFKNYREIEGLKQVIDLKDFLGVKKRTEEIDSFQSLEQTLESMKKLISPVTVIECEEELTGFPLEESGTIYYQEED